MNGGLSAWIHRGCNCGLVELKFGAYASILAGARAGGFLRWRAVLNDRLMQELEPGAWRA